LVVGGYGPSGVRKDACIYTPSTGVCQVTGELSTARESHTATPLDDGRVLVVGGFGNTGARLATGEVWNGSTWTPVANSMLSGTTPVPRTAHTAEWVDKLVSPTQGGVLIVGGMTSATAVTNTAQVYNPVTNQFLAAMTMPAARHRHTSTFVLGRNRVYIIGGKDTASGTTDPAAVMSYSYNTSTSVWTWAISTTSPTVFATALRGRFDHTTTETNDGRLIVVGGSQGATTPPTVIPLVDYYNLNTNSWSVGNPLTTARARHTANRWIYNGSAALVVGGIGAGGGALDSAELHHHADNTWRSVSSPMAVRRVGHTATDVTANHTVLVIGGENPSLSQIHTSVEIFKYGEIWVPTANATTGRVYHTATAKDYAGTSVLVAGGWNGAALASADKFTMTGTGWTAVPVATPMSSPRYGHAATALSPSGDVLVSGGSNGSAVGSAVLDTTDLYSWTSGSWTPGKILLQARRYHTATTLSSGKVLVTGGEGRNLNVLATAEILDPAAATPAWTFTGDMPSPRHSHTATLLSSGKVLVVGGYISAFYPTATAAIFDPGSGTWSGAGTMSRPRAFHSASRLADGTVLVAGGYDGSATLSDSEIFNPNTLSWAPAGTMAGARDSHVGLVLPNNNGVLVVGGIDGQYPIVRTELFVPGAGWRNTAMSPARGRYLPTGIVNTAISFAGEALIVGGWDAQVLNSADHYVQ
jgi:N-acetylneuraminic acid mutarotase